MLIPKYKDDLSTLPEFKHWLTESRGISNRMYCLVCNKHVGPHRSSMKSHADTKYHKNNFRLVFPQFCVNENDEMIIEENQSNENQNEVIQRKNDIEDIVCKERQVLHDKEEEQMTVQKTLSNENEFDNVTVKSHDNIEDDIEEVYEERQELHVLQEEEITVQEKEKELSHDFANIPDSSIQLKKRNQKRYQSHSNFKEIWLTESWSFDWLSKMEDPKKALCTLCDKILLAHKYSLIKHAKKMHGKNFFDNLRAELKLCAFYVEKNLSFNLTTEMIPLCRQIFIDSKISENISLERHKMRKIILEIFQAAHLKKMSSLKSQCHSMLVDEATDISTSYSMNIVARYFDEKKGKVCESLLDIVQLYNDDENSSADADTLLDRIEMVYEKLEIPFENMIGFCCEML